MERKELVFPKDQELFLGIDENGMLLPFEENRTLADTYENKIYLYKS